MNRKKFFGCAFVMAILFAGCATDPASSIAEHAITSVAIDQRVDVPTLRYGQKTGGSLQASLTELIVDSVYANDVKLITKVMQENQIDVASMVRSNFVTAVRDLGYEVADKQADATFVVKLEQYGINEVPWSMSKQPFVVLRGELIKTDGQVIWWGRSDGRKSKDPELMGVKEWDEYERDPERLRNDWNAVARQGVARLLRGAKKQ